MIDAYLETEDGAWFVPTEYARGPWLPDACHAGPPAALLARAMEHTVAEQRLARITVELMRPIPMRGFRVRASIAKRGRSVSSSEAELYDDAGIYARASGLHLRTLGELEVTTAAVASPDFSASVEGPFPVPTTAHGLTGFNASVECRYDPSAVGGRGGPTTMWMRTKVPLLADEEPSPFQRICPLADCLNGISYNGWLDEVWFMNADLTLSLHRDPVGEWFCAQAISHWEPTGVGLADGALFDVEGPVGRATQSLLLSPASE
jgi:Acyl-CoA thioesterase C-terminal domain/Acyl-CoA thioesterase N-terminal domain